MSSNSKDKKSGVSRPILGTSPLVKRLVEMIEKVAPTKTNILVNGESGTGKELVARMIHELSPLNGKPFVPVNCGAIPETLIESEMFGHRKGSFTGAVHEKQGLFEVAHGGTLFLDEVGELPLSMQVKLLRAIQERSFRKVGGTEDIKVDVRVIAATNRDLEEGVKKGSFREDLYYRLNVIQLKSPPLRERVGDIQLLAEAFLKKFSARSSSAVNSISDEAMLALKAWSWPGNVRELENVIERGVTLEMGSSLSLGALPAAIQESWSVKGGTSQHLFRKNEEQFDTDAQDLRIPVKPGTSIETTELGIRFPRLELKNSKIEAIDLKQIIMAIEKFYYEQAKALASESSSELARVLGLNPKELKALEKKLGL